MGGNQPATRAGGSHRSPGDIGTGDTADNQTCGADNTTIRNARLTSEHLVWVTAPTIEGTRSGSLSAYQRIPGLRQPTGRDEGLVS